MTGVTGPVATVFRKELTDYARDHRALLSVVFGLVVGPVAIGLLLNGVAAKRSEAAEVDIPVVGQAHAPAFVTWLGQQRGVRIVNPPEDPEAAVGEGSAEVVVIIPEDFAEDFRVSRPVSVTLVSDSARQSAQPVVERVRQLVQGYSSEVAGLRLIGRVVSPAAVSPLLIEELDVSSAQQRAARILSFIPLLIVLAAFSGGMQLATDSTAGERERGSLEALLINPVRRLHVAVGKWLAAVVAAMLSVALTTALMVVVVHLIATEDLGLRFRLGGFESVGILAAVLPMCLLSAALQTCIATLARTFKEAQTYMGLLLLAPLAPGLIGTLYPLGDAPWMYGVPLLGTHVLLEGVIGGRAAGVPAFLGAAGVSVLLAGALVLVTTRLFASERVVFGR